MLPFEIGGDAEGSPGEFFIDAGGFGRANVSRQAGFHPPRFGVAQEDQQGLLCGFHEIGVNRQGFAETAKSG